MTFGPTKGHQRRDVPLPRFLIEELARHVETSQLPIWCSSASQGP